MKKYYSVKTGRKPGIYTSWDECKEQVSGFANAEFKGFNTLAEAEAYINDKKPDKANSNALLAYVDGSFNTEKMNYSYGVVLVFNDKVIETLNGMGNNPEAAKIRNVAGELKGAMIAMNYAIKNGYDELIIYHDYKGIAKWAQNEWKTNSLFTIKYKEFYNNICNKLKISFIKVTAHSGDKYNEMADKLAKAVFQ